MTQKEMNLKSKPWMTKDILEMIDEREEIHKSFTKTKSPQKEYHYRYKELRDKVILSKIIFF